MKPRTEIINHQIVNSLEQLACFLRPGDLFRKVRGMTKYRFESLDLNANMVKCINLDTLTLELIYYHSPVFKLIIS